MQGGAMGNLKSAIFNGERRDLRDLALNETIIFVSGKSKESVSVVNRNGSLQP